ncbi:MAG: hypothetical protein AAGE52_32180 [Myxococcota bacterium]
MRWIALGLVLALACGDDDGAGSDAGGRDSGGPDSGTTDSGSVDSGGGVDSGTTDAGAEDGGAEDGGAADTGAEDAGSEDAGSEDAGSDGAAEDGGAADAGDGTTSGECTTSADCRGAECVELIPGGYRVCQDPDPEATSCVGGGFGDMCCNTSECAEGLCITTPIIPFCGGIRPVEMNLCATDQCESDAECRSADDVCLPARVLGRKVRSCLAAECRTDADCTDGVDGQCMPVREACCGTSVRIQCVYEDDCPRTSCEPGSFCELGVCRPGFPICPA